MKQQDSRAPLDSAVRTPLEQQQLLATQNRPQFRQRDGGFPPQPLEARLGRLTGGGQFSGRQGSQFDQFDPRDQFRGQPPQQFGRGQFAAPQGAPIQRQQQVEQQQVPAPPPVKPDRSQSRFKSIAYDETDGEGAVSPPRGCHQKGFAKFYGIV